VSGAGGEVFFKVLDALLDPDYTDEEIRRGVCNFGVTENSTRRCGWKREGLGVQRDGGFRLMPPGVPF
jgi:hypothetical protein